MPVRHPFFFLLTCIHQHCLFCGTGVGQKPTRKENLSVPCCEACLQPQLFSRPDNPGTAFALPTLQVTVEV